MNLVEVLGAAAIIAGIIVGLASDYLVGNIVVTTLIASAMIGVIAENPKSSAAYSLISNMMWLTISVAYSLIQDGALKMVAITTEIAGIPMIAAYALVYVVVAILAPAVSATTTQLTMILIPEIRKE